ncbi:MAG: PIN domain-containing protein [Candidatus Woesearchaeota archaeon]
MIGLDTTILIDLYKKDKKALKLVQSINQNLYLNILTYLELIRGIDPKNNKHQHEQTFYDKIFDVYPCLELDKTSAKLSRNIFWKLKKEGKTISLIDATIAAIYLANGVKTIITKNKKDFEQIEGLEVLSY